jgi:hypothetical protein
MFYYRPETRAVIGRNAYCSRSNVNMEWPNEKVFCLVKLYEDDECLYNVRSPEYHNRTKKKLVLHAIAKELNTSVTYKNLKYINLGYMCT